VQSEKANVFSNIRYLPGSFLHDKTNTKDMLLRRKWHVTDNHNCILCQAGEYEDWRHLFFYYLFNLELPADSMEAYC
jgi:hypothetical protein